MGHGWIRLFEITRSCLECTLAGVPEFRFCFISMIWTWFWRKCLFLERGWYETWRLIVMHFVGEHWKWKTLWQANYSEMADCWMNLKAETSQWSCHSCHLRKISVESSLEFLAFSIKHGFIWGTTFEDKHRSTVLILMFSRVGHN